MRDSKSEPRRSDRGRLEPRARVTNHGSPAGAWTGRAGMVALAATFLTWGCTNEQVVSVDVSRVRVTPTNASALEGEDVQLTATVLDENSVPVDGATVTWTSQDTSIVSVDGVGIVRARSAGVTTVRASFRGAWGEATIRVLSGPEIVVSRDSVPLSTVAGASSPDPEVIQVTNGGGTGLEDVSVQVEHPADGPSGWLDASLSGSTLPATLTLTADTDGMSAGAYMAHVAITAPGAGNSPLTIPVTLSLTGFTIRESGGGTSVNEGGSEDSFTVVLDLEPASDVVLTVSSADAGEVDVSPRTLRFEPADWRTPRTVTVEGIDDDDADGPQVTLVTVAVDEDQSDEVFERIPEQTVRVTTFDDDAPSFSVVETGGSTSVAESGTTDQLRVRLAVRPTSQVVIDVVSADPLEATVDPPSLTFTPSSWDDVQTVTVTGEDDTLIDGDQTTAVTLSVNEGQSDDAFDDVPSRTVSVTTMDDDAAGFALSESGGGTSVGEAGGTDAVQVVLTARPASDVVLSVTSADTGEMAVDPASLTFTPGNWDDPRTVTVTGIDDALADGDQITQLTVSVDDAASDDAFDGLADRSVAVTTVDDDAAALVVRETGGGTSVSEGGSTDDFTVELASQPLADVVVDVTSSDPGEATVAPASLTFTAASWATAQTVTVTGVNDAAADGPQTTAVTVSVRSGSSDPAYGSAADETVIVTTMDDDVPGFTVTQTGGTTVTEAGGTDDFTVVLTTEPQSSVTLTVTSGDVAEVTVSPGTLTFTPGNWSAAQTVTLTGVDDPAVDGDQVSTVRISVDDASSDDGFDGVADQTVDVTTRDDDTPGFGVTESAGTTVVTEAGGTDDFAVALLAQPTSDVVLTLTASDVDEATVSPATLTFTTVSWNLGQTVTVTGVDDLILDGDQASTVTIAVDGSASDDAFDAVSDQTVAVTTRDDEVPGFSVTESAGTTVVTESSGTDDLTVVLLVQPTSDVVLTLTPSDPGEATVSPTALTFTTTSWGDPRVVTVTGVDDLLLDGDQVSTITIAIDRAASQDAFDGLPAQTVSVTTRDNFIIGSADEPTSGPAASVTNRP